VFPYVGGISRKRPVITNPAHCRRPATGTCHRVAHLCRALNAAPEKVAIPCHCSPSGQISASGKGGGRGSEGHICAIRPLLRPPPFPSLKVVTICPARTALGAFDLHVCWADDRLTGLRLRRWETDIHLSISRSRKDSQANAPNACAARPNRKFTQEQVLARAGREGTQSAEQRLPTKRTQPFSAQGLWLT
jgi:hypothetical protein